MEISSLEKPVLRIYLCDSGLISATTSVSLPNGSTHHWVGGTEDPDEFISWIHALEIGEFGNQPAKLVCKFYIEDKMGETKEICENIDQIPTQLRFLLSGNT